MGEFVVQMKTRISKSRIGLAAVCIVSAVVLSGPVTGQEDRMARPAEATIYRDAAYNGPAVAVSQANNNLGLAWPVNSIRVRNGRWELCERTNFRGNCRTVDRDTLMLGSVLRGITVQSMRPLGGGGGGGGGPVPPVPPVTPDQTVRGRFAEFHTAPQARGARILSCRNGNSTANCAARTADAYCVSIGWNGAAVENQETVGRDVYLADVLCVRSGF